ncbi:MAG: major facilitator superfamily 1 [Candidatus Eremiobacteraeota bacterium]|nr:major facilitator superfamily 1 [Candidatus Eremiobacteraeota bacterium]
MRTQTAALIPIYGVTLIDVLGTMIMVPLLPYVAQHYGANGLTVGTILTTSAVAGTIAAPVWGSVSDRLGRKRIVLIAQVVSLAGYVMLALAHSLALIFVARAIAGFGSGGIGVTQSYIADVTDEKDRDRAYALFGAVFGLGIVLGPVVGGLLIRYGFWAPFAAAALIEAITIALTLRFLPETSPHGGAKANLRRATRVVMTDPRVRSVVVRHLLFIFSVTYFFTVFSLFLKRQLDVGPEVSSGLLAGAGAVGGIALIAVVDPLAKRYGDVVVSQIGLALLVVAYTALAYVHALWVFGAALALWAIGAASVEPTLTALLSKRAPPDERGAIMGFNDAANNVALIVAPVLGGEAVDLDPHLVGIIPAIAAFLALAIGLWRERTPSPRAAAKRA